MNFELSPENTSAGKAFKTGWDSFVRLQHLPDVFWDPVDQRWENYARAKWGFVRTQMPAVPLRTDYWAERTILHEVLNIGETTRVLDAKIVWDPRDGFWYQWHSLAAPAPGAPSVPVWLVQLNADLDSIARNTHLTAEERFQARSALIQRIYGLH